MLFCKKEKKKGHFLMKLLLVGAGVAGTVVVCNVGTKKIASTAKKLWKGITKSFKTAPKQIESAN